MIGIVDLDMGNLRSVANAVEQSGFDVQTVRGPGDLEGVTHVILPGVGSYAVAMSHMRAQSLFDPLRARALGGTPTLGICLGMQLLSSHGDEGGGAEGLGLVPGRVRRLDPARVPTIPHVGWNELKLLTPHPVFQNVKSGIDFYYVHSYHFVCDESADVLGTVEYGGQDFAAFIGRNNVIGFQFHPEKSQANGLRLIENFCAWGGAC